jgi:UDP-2,3-diacylglucosamine pyrophosphatase LpxH
VAKFKLVVSDFHIGKGRVLSDGSVNILEDFIADRQFAEFLDYYSSGVYYDAEIELILLGDILNLIQVDYRGYYSPVLTEEISLEKLKTCVRGHPDFFKALREFLKLPNKKVTYILGNHDTEMIWEKCKSYFSEQVGAPVLFKNFTYVVDGVLYEHGQQYEAVNRLDPKKLFITKGLKEPILNLPWGSHFLINFIVPIKLERPAIDKVRPVKAFIRWSLLTDTVWTLKMLVRGFFYFFATRFSKSLYRTSNLITTFKILKEILFYHPSITESVGKILEQNPDYHTVIMGHTHYPHYKQFEDGREYINTGTWTEVTNLSMSNLGRGTRYTYAFIDYSANPARPHAYLREWMGRWHEQVDCYIGT